MRMVVDVAEAAMKVPSIWGVLSHIAKEHISYHLSLPLGAGFLTEAAANYFLHPERRTDGFWAALQKDVLTLETGVFVLGVLVAYLIIMYRETVIETSTNVDHSLLKLKLELSDAVAYTGISTLLPREWFDPVSLVYFTKVAGQKFVTRQNGSPERTRPFRDERVMLVSRERDKASITMPSHPNWFYGKLFARMHKYCGTPLAYLHPEEIKEVLCGLDGATRNKLCRVLCFRTTWWPFSHPALLNRVPAEWFRLCEQGYGMIERADGQRSIIRVAKKGRHIIDIEVVSGAGADAYITFSDKIKSMIYLDGKLREDHDFYKLYEL